MTLELGEYYFVKSPEWAITSITPIIVLVTSISQDRVKYRYCNKNYGTDSFSRTIESFVGSNPIPVTTLIKELL